MNNNFCHLHNHSERSYLDGFGSAQQYIAKAKELGMNAIAITDHGVIDGCIDWQNEADKQGVQCILGCEAYIVPNARIKKQNEKRGHIVFLVKNQSGWTELCKLLTKANLEGFYYRPRIDFDDLLNADLSGLIILTGCAASFINLDGGIDLLKGLFFNLSGNDIYLEIMPHDFDKQYELHKKILELHNEYKIPLVATNDCHYIEKDDWETQEVLLAINRNAKWNDPKRWKFGIKDLHIRTKREMQLAFRKHCFTTEQINQALSNTMEIAKKCSGFRIPKQEISLPMPPRFKDQDPDETLNELCMEGYKNLFGNRWKKEYKERYNEEFEIIKEKNFSKYFLIFWDAIQWCKENGVPVGPGRGSVGGSLIALLLGITRRVDPIKYNLLFSRFISKDRTDWPDIDVDFAKRDRERVRNYIRQTYGENHTCGISTDMRLKSKAAVQAVGRVFETPEKDIRAFSSVIEKNKGDLEKAIDDGKWFEKKYPKIVYFTRKIENQVRGVGQHAAGQIISDEDLTLGTKCVLTKRKNINVANWGMNDCEYSGLMKMDILGLSTLSVLSECEGLINEKGE